MERRNTNAEDEDVGQHLEAPEVRHSPPIVSEGPLAEFATAQVRALGFTQRAQTPLLTESIGRCDEQSDQVATVPEDCAASPNNSRLVYESTCSYACVRKGEEKEDDGVILEHSRPLCVEIFAARHFIVATDIVQLDVANVGGVRSALIISLGIVTFESETGRHLILARYIGTHHPVNRY